MALQKREKTLLAVTIAVVVIGGNYLLFTPLSNKWKQLNGDIKKEQELLEGMRATLAHAPEWQSQYERLQGKMGSGTEHFATPSDVVRKIDEVGTAAGVIMINRRQLTVVEKGEYKELPVQCSFEATIDSLVKFLQGVQKGSGFIIIDQLRIQPRPDSSGILRCDIQIRALESKTTRGGS